MRLSEDRIKEALKKICTKKGQSDIYPILEKAFAHILKHENEPNEERARSIKKIIEVESKGE